MEILKRNKLTLFNKLLFVLLLLTCSIFLFACNEDDPPHKHSYEELTISATCKNEGVIGQKCSTCNDIVVSQLIDKLTHSYVELYKNPDCENDGYLANVCEKCGDKQITKTLNKLGHDYVIDELIIDHNEIDNCGKFICQTCEDIEYRTITPADISMPILSLNGSMEGISKENKITIAVSYESDEISFESDATLKWQGASSLGYPKKNFNIQFLKTGTDKKNKVEIRESWGKQSKYTLKANWIDYSQARNVVSGKIYNQIVHSRNLEDEVSTSENGGAVDGFPIVIYLNGNFEGLYTLNIPKDNWMWGMEDDEEGDDVVTKQACLSTGNWLPDAMLVQQIEDYSDTVELEYCSTEDTIGDEWVLDSFNDMISFINSATDEEFKQNIGNYVNLERTIDTIIYTQTIMAVDNLAKNILWLTYDGVHWFSSMYDMDATWGLIWHGESYCSDDANLFTNVNCNKLWQRIISLYKKEIAIRYFELRMNVLSMGNIVEQFNSFDNSIIEEIRNVERERWTEVPSQDTNNIQQIINYIEKRFIYLDNLMFSFL